jgi:hypothetical protein
MRKVSLLNLTGSWVKDGTFLVGSHHASEGAALPSSPQKRTKSVGVKAHMDK